MRHAYPAVGLLSGMGFRGPMWAIKLMAGAGPFLHPALGRPGVADGCPIPS
jgi:hypothetical protein